MGQATHYLLLIVLKREERGEKTKGGKRKGRGKRREEYLCDESPQREVPRQDHPAHAKRFLLYKCLLL